MNAAEIAETPGTVEADLDFERQMLVARGRWNVTLEARGLATRMLADGSFGIQALRDQLIVKVAHATPKSRLIPWHLNDAVAETIIEAVAREVAKSWI
jgi:hypothetical protein